MQKKKKKKLQADEMTRVATRLKRGSLPPHQPTAKQRSASRVSFSLCDDASRSSRVTSGSTAGAEASRETVLVSALSADPMNVRGPQYRLREETRRSGD